MQRALFMTAAAVAALSLAACNKNSNGANTTDNGTNTAAASGNASDNSTSTSDTNSMNPGQSTPVNKAQDTMGAAVGAMSASTMGSHDTGAFVSNLVQGNTYEIEAAKIAESKAKDPEVKSFAKRMVTDHTALGNEAKPVIAKSGQTPPTSLDQRRQGFLDNLKAAGPNDFDKTYIDQQVAAHQETISLLQGYAKDGSDAGLKALAAKASPKVQMHLELAKKIQAKLSGGSK